VLEGGDFRLHGVRALSIGFVLSSSPGREEEVWLRVCCRGI